MAAVVWNVSKSGCHPSLAKFLDELTRRSALAGVTVTVGSVVNGMPFGGARSDADVAVLYSWGRTVKNPDMDRTGDRGPNGLGVYATNARDASQTAHGWRKTPVGVCWCAVDVDVSPASAMPAVAAVAAEFGIRWGGDASRPILVSGVPDVRHFEVEGWQNFEPVSGPSSKVGLVLGLAALAGFVAVG